MRMSTAESQRVPQRSGTVNGGLLRTRLELQGRDRQRTDREEVQQHSHSCSALCLVIHYFDTLLRR